jgi:serine/threonine protein phosphatase PrpC
MQIRQYLCSSPETHFFGLFDGHAGGRCSKFVSQSLPEILAEDSSFSTNLHQVHISTYLCFFVLKAAISFDNIVHSANTKSTYTHWMR